MLALLSEHLELLLKIFQSFLDRLLTFVALLVTLLERRGELLAILSESHELLIFAAQCFIKLLNQIILHLKLIVDMMHVHAIHIALSPGVPTWLQRGNKFLAALVDDRVSRVQVTM